MKIALVQMQSSNQLDKNLSKMREWVKVAKRQGANLIIFPEMAYFTGKREDWLPIIPKFESLQTTFQTWAKEENIAVVPGTLREPLKNDQNRYYNTLLFVEPSGKIAKYQKVFLYQAVLPDRTYEESKYCAPGSQVVTHKYEGVTFGFSVCFDLRFPELFRSLKKRGAEVILMPSAFTVPTGTAHWEILVRARAIENQCFMITPDLTATSGDGAETYGHSLAVGPWGEILSKFDSKEGLQTFEIDLGQIEHTASKVASWRCRNETLFPIV